MVDRRKIKYPEDEVGGKVRVGSTNDKRITTDDDTRKKGGGKKKSDAQT